MTCCKNLPINLSQNKRYTKNHVGGLAHFYRECPCNHICQFPWHSWMHPIRTQGFMNVQFSQWVSCFASKLYLKALLLFVVFQLEVKKKTTSYVFKVSKLNLLILEMANIYLYDHKHSIDANTGIWNSVPNKIYAV